MIRAKIRKKTYFYPEYLEVALMITMVKLVYITKKAWEGSHGNKATHHKEHEKDTNLYYKFVAICITNNISTTAGASNGNTRDSADEVRRKIETTPVRMRMMNFELNYFKFEFCLFY